MRLSELVGADSSIVGLPDREIEITSITADSRQVRPGALFAALPGSQFDGRQFIPSAVAAGAAAILTTLDVSDLDASAGGAGSAILLRSADARRSLALMAARFFGRQPHTTVAVTGTSGKTSVADFARQIFLELGCRAASVGTIGVVKPDGRVYGSLTTPDPVTLHSMLADLVGEGVTHLAFEASSHGLDQRRLDGVQLKAAGFTNFGRDHLDYHATVEEYMAAKLRLFDTLLPLGGIAVVNLDDPSSGEVVGRAAARGIRVLGVGQSADAELRLESISGDDFSQDVVFAFGGVRYPVRLDLIGSYQASNVAIAAGLAIASGEDAAAVFSVLGGLSGVKGRLEVVGRRHDGQAEGAPIVIDYAHKPDALEAVLKALRPFVRGRLICVLGCGGDRDRGKRPIMGRIAQEKADLVIVTDDNPRGEDAAQIRREILSAAQDAREIGDRFEAIAEAIQEAQPGDVVVIAGKGHETGQIVGDKTLPFSDHDAVAEVLSRM